MFYFLGINLCMHTHNNHNADSFLSPCRQKIVKNYGVIECDPLVLRGLDKTVCDVTFRFDITFWHP